MWFFVAFFPWEFVTKNQQIWTIKSTGSAARDTERTALKKAILAREKAALAREMSTPGSAPCKIPSPVGSDLWFETVAGALKKSSKVKNLCKEAGKETNEEQKGKKMSKVLVDSLMAVISSDSALANQEESEELEEGKADNFSSDGSKPCPDLFDRGENYED